MAKITLKEALKQASVVDELKNFVGLTKDDAVGLMTPERLAAVAGELGRYVIGTDGSKFVFFKGSLSTKNGNIEPISIAKSVMDYIPLFNDATAVRFDCVHNEAGRRVVRGLLYSTRDYGFFEISGINGKPEKVVLNNGNFSLAQ